MIPFKDDGFVWMKGQFVPWKDAKIVIGSGKRGPVVNKLQEEFLAIVRAAELGQPQTAASLCL